MTQTMTSSTSNNDLNTYYTAVQQTGKLRTPDHARRWSHATLRTLALNLNGRTKKQLANALPEELSKQLKRQFWLLHFRNKSLTCLEFQKMVANRAGNTDAQFARYPVTATFHSLKSLIPTDVSKAVADTLSPELSEMWQNA